ncbi:unnamed protein product [Blumeria hordei]|uniref:Isoleucine--tRNA ligase, mitochondrial n=2 Tax=Blumeria hordei TaxID=2867405 RepID=A0A383UM81_BLUHO|nr:isoleucyl-, valyl-tRNA synthetase [Blumeria hordei DH14]SZF01413.1 unnamed protein product [Blumeria hordei]
MLPRLPLKSWASTLRLPKSTFPARPSAGDQIQYLKRCSDDLYQWQNRERSEKEPFVLHDGPPYANGELHIGHALNKILKDIICRVKIQQGKRVIYIPGWDCHGLPIELKAIERQNNLRQGDSDELNSDKIRQAARDLASETIKQQKKGFREWGVIADWDNAWNTMDLSYTLDQLRVFQTMVRDGLIFRRNKPVYWSPSTKTALAEAELEYENNHRSTAAYVKFQLTTMPQILHGKIGPNDTISILIWTTTPWTLPANRAIAVNCRIEYSLIRHDSNLLLIARSRVEHVRKVLFGEENIEVIVNSILGSDLEDAKYSNCLRGPEIQPIIHADFVSADSGTGFVHLAPGHGQDDYEVCQKHGITAVAPVDDSGRFTADAYPYDPSVLEGKLVMNEGSKEVLKLLGDKVLAVEKHRHKYPYDWRTKKPVIMRATEQWFADVEKIKSNALDYLKDVQFIPSTSRVRLESFVRARNEWCISRQRSWGVPIPALYTEDGSAVLNDRSVEHIISVIKKRGINAWWTDPIDDPAWISPGLKGLVTRGKDTMDVWFDSGTSWTQTPAQADIYLEGSDQHRGWFQSSLLTYTGSSRQNRAPFKTLITHGFTLDQAGKKMSKSIGNVIAPSQIMDGSLLPPTKSKKGKFPPNQELGADALRLWVASCDYTGDVVVGQDVLKSNHAALLKFRMILKMLLGSMHQTDNKLPVTLLDQIALTQLRTVLSEVSRLYSNYEFHKVVVAINRWINTDLSAFYLEAIKDRLYCGDGGSVLYEIFHTFLKMLTPITPLLVEEAWSHRPQWMKNQADTHLFYREDYQPILASYSRDDAIIASELPWLMKANAAIKLSQERARSQKLIGASLESSVYLDLPPPAVLVFQRYKKELDSIFVVSSVEFGASPDAEWKFDAKFDAPGGTATAWVLPPKDNKCLRCWRYLAPTPDKLCSRCEELVTDDP